MVQNLGLAIGKIQGATEEGFTKAALLVEGDAAELAPVDLGVLHNSTFKDVSVDANGNITARVGFTAKYAPWVHEAPMTLKGKPRANFGVTSNRSAVGPQIPTPFGGGSGRGFYWDGGENKFLEKAIKRNEKAILKIIEKDAKKALSK